MRIVDYIRDVVIWLLLFGVGMAGWVIVAWAVIQLARHFGW